MTKPTDYGLESLKMHMVQEWASAKHLNDVPTDLYPVMDKLLTGVFKDNELLITNEEVNQLFQTVGSRIHEEFYSFLFNSRNIAKLIDECVNLPRFKELTWQTILENNGLYYYSIIDLQAKKEYLCNSRNHLTIMCKIINEFYYDEYTKLSQSDQSKFVSDNFIIKHSNFSYDFNTPLNEDLQTKFTNFDKVTLETII